MAFPFHMPSARDRAIGLLIGRVRRQPAVRERLLRIADRVLDGCSRLAWFDGRIAHDLLCVEAPCLGAGVLRRIVETQEAEEAVVEALAVLLRRLLGLGARARAAAALRALDWDAYARRVERLEEPWAEVLDALRYPPPTAQADYERKRAQAIALCQEAAVVEKGAGDDDVLAR